MTRPVLHDAVTLRHFAAVRRLDVLKARAAHRDEPRWVHEVREEIRKAADAGQTSCADIIAAGWLGDAQSASESDLAEIMRMRTRLGGDHPEHLGEAASIYWAERLDGTFVTDDNAAYQFAAHRLGDHRVIDTVAVLCDAVASGDITDRDAAAFCDRLRSLRPEPRHLRSVHPDPLLPEHFQ